ncbi:MAG: penicillin-binding protein 2 [Anaerolineales bacterium]|nr:penicillin-binding protein 2 [Anaerolineales bacterium]MDW8278187.1 penicillin-binding protein 2 [Anaerolineales bacterium]
MTTSAASRAWFEAWRALVLYVVLGLAFSFMVARLFVYQVIEHPLWVAQAEENRTRVISVPPSRGIIYDRNGYILASNVASYNIIIIPANLPDSEGDVQAIYRQLSALTGVPVNKGTVEDAKLVSPCVPGPGIAQIVELQRTNAPYSPAKIQCNVSEEVARIVREKAVDWPGVSIEIEPVRNYPTGSLTANIIGFLGPIPASQEQTYREQGFQPNRDKVGYAGVEVYFNDLLMGKPGRRVVEVDVAGQELRNLEPPIAPVSGYNLHLTIDTRLQKAMESALVGEINSWNQFFYGGTGQQRISSGAMIAINPKTGEILAMVTYPTFENNRLARFIPAYYYNQLAQDPRKPLLNYAVSTEYPPGSVFKLSTALGALNEGVVTLNQILESPPELVVRESFSPNDPGFERTFVDWNKNGFGTISFLRCIAYSSNVCFYKLGGGYREEVREGLGILRLKEYARALGYDQVSGIELPGEADGLIPDPRWKRIFQGENWSTGDTYIASVGQGYVLATPLQVLLSAATIANNGRHMQATIIKELTDNNGTVIPLWRDQDGNFYFEPGPGRWQISPNQGHVKWDMTIDAVIKDYFCENSYCTETGNLKTVDPFVIQKVQEGMRLAVTDPTGTLHKIFVQPSPQFPKPFPIAVAGKTGTAEYCDDVARAANRCRFGEWPTHSWTVAYAPYEDPEIAVVAFAYNGGEGASVAAPMVRLALEAYFCLKTLDSNPGSFAGCN